MTWQGQNQSIEAYGLRLTISLVRFFHKNQLALRTFRYFFCKNYWSWVSENIFWLLHSIKKGFSQQNDNNFLVYELLSTHFLEQFDRVLRQDHLSFFLNFIASAFWTFIAALWLVECTEKPGKTWMGLTLEMPCSLKRP